MARNPYQFKKLYKAHQCSRGGVKEPRSRSK
jgi:hypothetical protein